MKTLLWLSVFWIIYGIAGLFGFQNIPAKYKGHSWTKDYIRCQGATWLMLGLPLFAFYLLWTFFFADAPVHPGSIVLIVLVLAIPSLMFTITWEKKYKALLAVETDTDNKIAE